MPNLFREEEQEDELTESEEEDDEGLDQGMFEGMEVDENEQQSSHSTQLEQTVEEVLHTLQNRYKYSGGSARWMFNYTLATIDKKLRDYCNSAQNRSAILDGDIGPTSTISTNYFFGSSRTSDGEADYFLVSPRAVEVLGNATQSTAFKTLYDFAKQLENLALMGWVVEADFFEQVKKPPTGYLSIRQVSHQLVPHSCRALFVYLITLRTRIV